MNVTKPNLLLLSLVPVRADRLGCYGYERDTTPTIDALAGEATLFENAYATSPWTPPSHASTMTGLYPWHNGVIGDAPLADGITTMAQHLARYGYRTCAFVNTHHMGAYKRLDAGFDEFQQIGTGGWRARRHWLGRELERRGLIQKKKGTAATTSQVIGWLDAHAHSSSPFFLFVHYHEAHHPYAAPAPYRGRYSGFSRRPSRGSPLWQANLDPHAFFTQRIALSPADIRVLSDSYDEELAFLDGAHIAVVLDRLKRLGVYDNTVIIVTSPHGESLGEHGLLSHVGGLYETLLRVPLVIREPGGGSGRREPGLAQVTDIFPTVTRLLGVPDPVAPLDGRALPPFADSAERRTFVAAEWSGGGFGAQDLAEAMPLYERRLDILSRLTERQWALRIGNYKYIEWEHGRQELYDLDVDPGETEDSAAQQRPRVLRFAAQLRNLTSSGRLGEAPIPHVPPNLAADLRAQGYRT